jgi:CBS domain-containing membrane protein
VSLAKVRNPSRRAALGAFGAAAFMGVLTLLDELTRGAVNLPALVPPFGASVVIVFFTPDSPFGKAWNVIVGHLCCAFVAALVLTCLPDASTGLLAALAVSGAGLLMLATRSFHPPGGATALLAVIAERRLGFAMLLCPMLIGAVSLSGMRLLLDGVLARLHARVPAEADVPALASEG